MGQPGDLVDVAGDVLLGAVGQQGIGVEGPAGRGKAHGRAGHRAGVDRFGQVHHLGQLVLDVGGLGRALHVAGHGAGPDDDVTDPALAAAVVLPVQGGEPLDQRTAELGLAAHEHPIHGHEHVLEHEQGLAAHQAVVRLAHVDPALELAVVVGLAAEDLDDPRRVQGHGADQGVVGVLGPHELGGHDQDLVAVGRPGLMGLGPPDDDPVALTFDHAGEQVRVGLLVRGPGPVALDVGHPADDHLVGLLDVFQVFQEPLVIVGPHLLVDVIGGHVGRVQGVPAHAALKAGARLVGDGPEQLDFLDQVLDRLVDVGEPGDLLPGQVAYGRGQVLVLGHEGHLIGLGRGVDVGDEGRMFGHVLDPLAVVIDHVALLLEALDVVLFGLDVHHVFPLSMRRPTTSEGGVRSSFKHISGRSDDNSPVGQARWQPQISRTARCPGSSRPTHWIESPAAAAIFPKYSARS